eukprot:m.13529 g.13529  ORF g.13529 m.13529 type:complete len:77 (+) comp10175_c0_seq2:219-449(+)
MACFYPVRPSKTHVAGPCDQQQHVYSKAWPKLLESDGDVIIVARDKPYTLHFLSLSLVELSDVVSRFGATLSVSFT